MDYRNNSITGTWVSADAGAYFIGGDVTHFRGTVSETGEEFNATYTGFGLSISGLPISASAGGFTFNGPLNSFLGWSGGISGTGGVQAGYSMSLDGYSLVMYGAGTNVAVGAMIGYTDLDTKEHEIGLTEGYLKSVATNNPDGPEAAAIRALGRGDDVAAAHAMTAIPYFYSDRIVRMNAGGESLNAHFVSPTEGAGADFRREGSDGRREGVGIASPNRSNEQSPHNATSGTSTAGSGGGGQDSGRVNGGGSTWAAPTQDRIDHVVRGDRTLGGLPVLLDLDGNGVQVSGLSRSTRFVAGEDGLQHRTAWAGSGDGVLFYDVGGDGKITDQREYVFTEWAPGATDDMAALRAVFDSNGDGKLTAADAKFSDFKVLVTNADGTTTAKTLAQLGITEINLLPDTTKITLPDGSTITGQSGFVMGGTTRTAANVTLMAEAQGYRTVQTSSLDSSGARVIKTTGYASNGDKAFVMVQTTSADGLSVTNTYDSDGDGVVDQIQTIRKVGATETVENLRGADGVAAVVRRRVKKRAQQILMNGYMRPANSVRKAPIRNSFAHV